jgi:hypothetical protein
VNIRYRVAVLVLSAALAACGRGDKQGASGSGETELDRDKAIALSQPAFSSDFMLHINPDDTDMINEVDTHVSNPYPTQAAAPTYPCHADLGANATDFLGSLDGDNGLLNNVIGTWLQESGWVQTSTHSLSFMGNVGVETRSFVCRQVTREPLRYLQGAPDNMDVHHGLIIPLFRRACTAWTYANTYETDVPGKGKVKVFAGAFNYRLVPLVPGIITQGGGTYLVRMMLDPDTGRWDSGFQKTSDTGWVSWSPITPTSPYPDPPVPGTCSKVVSGNTVVAVPH